MVRGMFCSFFLGMYVSFFSPKKEGVQICERFVTISIVGALEIKIKTF